MASKSAYIGKNNKSGWRLHFKDHLGQWRNKVVYCNAKDADQQLYKLQLDEDQIRAGLRKPNNQSMVFEDAKEEWFDDLKADGRSQDTIDRYNRSMKAFTDFLGTTKFDISTITKYNIVRFKNHRSRTCTPNGVKIDLRHLKAFFNWCYNTELIDKTPVRGVSGAIVIKPVRYLTQDELTRLFEVTQSAPPIQQLIQFYIASGARANELLNPRFTWDNILENEIRLNGKNNKVRYIPISLTMREILTTNQNYPVPFPYSYDQMYHNIVRVAFKKAGITNANPHTLRKTTGAILVQQGVDIYHVSKYLGHSSVTVTEKHYADLLRENYQSQSNQLSDYISFFAITNKNH